MLHKNDNKSLDNITFLKFRKLYLVAIFLIALTIILAQILIQTHLNSQLNDSKIVNIAGRQRMLSQKLNKETLMLEAVDSDHNFEELLRTFEMDLEIFSKTHDDLQNKVIELGAVDGQDSHISSLFDDITQDQKELIRILKGVATQYHINQESGYRYIQKWRSRLNAVESRFLVKMDAIVNEYDAISQQKVKGLKQKEYILLMVALGILLLEIVFLFRPISIYIKKVIKNLIETEQNLKDKVRNVNELYLEKENSLQELQGLNYAINNAALFANLREDGTILHISKKFSRLIGFDHQVEGMLIDELLQLSDRNELTIKELIESHKQGIWTGEVQVLTQEGRKLWLEMSIVPMNQVRKSKSVLVLCTDITKRIESQNELVRLSEQRLKKEVDLQKAQASQIVEAQEEERKRIAKDIHDGIGQMLTALKFNVESINFDETDTVRPKVDKLKGLLGDLIKEVRAVTFNLTPPELLDYGVIPTLSKLTDQLSKLTGKRILFENKTNFAGRFDSLVETNLYRVVQEAVNNSLKYADANFILITVSHSKDKLSIVIDDDGKGFDPEKIESSSNDKGLGLFFMRERISYINGRIFIHSEKGKGTRITINIDLKPS